MLVESFEDFSKHALELYSLSPNKFRFTYSYRHKEGTLYLKATDDIIKVELETDQFNDLKKVEKLSRVLLFTMQDVPIPSLPDPAKAAVLSPAVLSKQKEESKDNSSNQPTSNKSSKTASTSNKKKNKKGKK